MREIPPDALHCFVRSGTFASKSAAESLWISGREALRWRRRGLDDPGRGPLAVAVWRPPLQNQMVASKSSWRTVVPRYWCHQPPNRGLSRGVASPPC